MNRKEILSYVGSMQQFMSVRPVIYREGRAEGMQAYEVKNDQLSFSVMADKCMDIAEVNWKGYNINFLSKPGLAGRNHYDTNGQEALRSIMGGMLFTSGLENICAPCREGEKDYPMHGRIRTTPAEHISADAFWEAKNDDERYKIKISGEMREAELFGENLILRRTIETTYQIPKIHIQDCITNEGFREEPMMILYHFNIGAPLLGPDSEIVLPSLEVMPRDEIAAAHVDQWNRMETPVDNEPEYVFLHRLAADNEGNTFAAILNEKLGIGIKISFSQKYLPWFMQWKSLASGDYVIGLEPANSSVYGRPYHVEKGDLHLLQPFETEEINLCLTMLSREDFEYVRNDADQLIKSNL